LFLCMLSIRSPPEALELKVTSNYLETHSPFHRSLLYFALGGQILDKTLAIPLNSAVLATGINGFIASHIADPLLLAGYRVRGTARTTSKAEGLKAYWEQKCGYGKVETKGAFGEAVKGLPLVSICHDGLS
jgi:hypothetical protein